MRHLITSTKRPKIDQKPLWSIQLYGHIGIDQSKQEIYFCVKNRNRFFSYGELVSEYVFAVETHSNCISNFSQN